MPDRSVTVVMPVLIQHDWQIPMTRCAIETLRCTTSLPFTMAVVETGSEHFKNDVDVHWSLSRRPQQNCTADLNFALDRIETTHAVYTGNDVFVRPGWLNALWECFDAFPDCGAATLASSDLSMSAQPLMLEGVYGPFMMFEKGWTFDAETFPGAFADTDLIMRLYRSGKRPYRNWRVLIHHLNQQTAPTTDTEANKAVYLAAKQRFTDRHKGCGLQSFRMLYEGTIF